MIHIVFGKSVEGSLNFALRDKNHQVIGFPIDFSIGPITNIHQESGVVDYFSWLNATHDMVWSGAENDEMRLIQALQSLSDINDGEECMIWTCDNANEQSGLRIVTYLLKDRDIKLATINTAKAMNAATKSKDVKIEILRTGECTSEELAQFLKSDISPLSQKMRMHLERQGKELLNARSLARSWKEGEIIHELETKDDAFILECAERLQSEMNTSDFILVAKLIGEVLGHRDQPLSDAWIEYRIRSLIQSGYFQRKGNTSMYEVKLI